MNKFGAELILKGCDLFTDSGLANPTFFRDSGEAPFFDDSDEYLHRIEFVHKPPYSSMECIPLLEQSSAQLF